MTFSDEGMVPLTPVNFFQIGADCFYLPAGKGENSPLLSKQHAKKYLLPDTSSLCGDTPFADVYLGWNEEGIEALVAVKHPVKKTRFPEIERGDSVEFFIDTRDVKTSGFNTRFCHHFFFLPEGVEGRFAGEITRFRTEDTHPLCEPKDLKVKCTTSSKGYSLHIFIPGHCLHGYDPEQFNRLGFSYRINQADGFPQHFTAVTEDFPIEQQPSLWGSLTLKR
jgi:hypothetical protein